MKDTPTTDEILREILVQETLALQLDTQRLGLTIAERPSTAQEPFACVVTAQRHVTDQPHSVVVELPMALDAAVDVAHALRDGVRDAVVVLARRVADGPGVRPS